MTGVEARHSTPDSEPKNSTRELKFTVIVRLLEDDKFKFSATIKDERLKLQLEEAEAALGAGLEGEGEGTARLLSSSLSSMKEGAEAVGLRTIDPPSLERTPWISTVDVELNSKTAPDERPKSPLTRSPIPAGNEMLSEAPLSTRELSMTHESKWEASVLQETKEGKFVVGQAQPSPPKPLGQLQILRPAQVPPLRQGIAQEAEPMRTVRTRSTRETTASRRGSISTSKGR